MTATDWDGESYCTHPDCGNQACHTRLTGMVGDIPLYELVCCEHAQESETV
jgi:hypothetical protein